MFRYLYLFCFLIITNTVAFAQQPNLGCNDKAMRLQAEQIKRNFITQGLVVYKDAMMSMESKQPFPVGVQFEKGKLYQLVFVGSREAKKMKIELFDGQDKKIDERSISIEGTQNFIVYSFVPEKTDMYLAVLSQSKGAKEMCGSFTIMQGNDANATQNENQDAKPNTNKPNPRYVPGTDKK